MSVTPAHIRKVLQKGAWDTKPHILESIVIFWNGRPDADTDLDVDELVRLATKETARRDLDHVLDQKLARTDYLNLFRQLDDAGVGRLIFGRRGHATRFKAWASDSLQTALSEMGITANDPFWKEPRLNPVTTASVNASVGVTPAATSPNRPTRESVVAELRKHQDEIRNFGVRSLGLFGSVARDEATPESDIDLLVTFKDSVTSDGFFGVKFFLEDLLGRRIDLVTDSALREPLRTAIQRELVNVA